MPDERAHLPGQRIFGCPAGLSMIGDTIL
jgi:hypothetical protein